MFALAAPGQRTAQAQTAEHGGTAEDHVNGPKKTWIQGRRDGHIAEQHQLEIGRASRRERV